MERPGRGKLRIMVVLPVMVVVVVMVSAVRCLFL